MNTTDAATRNLSLATTIVQECWDPPRPARFARFTSGRRAPLALSAFAAAFPDARLSVVWTVADDRRVAIGGRITATHCGAWREVEATGHPIDVACVLMLAFADGVVVDVKTLTDTLALAEQIGAVAPLGAPYCQLTEQP